MPGPSGEARKKCPFPFAVDDLGSLAETYAELRTHDPIPEVTLPSGDTAYLVTRYGDAQAVLSDRRFSANIGRPEAARLREGTDGNLSNPYADDRAWHLRWRKLLTRAFTPRQVEAVRGRIQEIAAGLADDMARLDGPVDLLQAFAFPLPVKGICEFLGIPVIEQDRVRGWVDALATSNQADTGERIAAGLAMREYALTLIEGKRQQPGDDLVTRLIAVHDDEHGRLNEDELVMTIIALIVGNNGNTARQIGQGMFTLLTNPEQLAALRANRDLLPGAVEEILRATPVYTALTRFATEEVRVGAVLIPQNSTVLVARESAHRDDTWVEEPDLFDIRRQTTGRHLSFGHGPSFCIGSSFAQLQLQCAFEALLDRFPLLRLAVPADEVSWTYRLMGSGPDEIPVTWTSPDDDLSESASPLTTLPFEQPHPLAVSPALRELQAEGTVHQVRTRAGDEAWMITGYDDVRRLLGDNRLGLSHPDPGNAARVNNSALFGGGPTGSYDTEQIDHVRFRSLLQPFFTPKRMELLRPRVEDLAAGLLKDMKAKGAPADLHDALSLPLSILVICELLGVPYEDRARFEAWSQAAADVADRQRSVSGLTDLWAYTKQLTTRKRAHPEDDVISGLCTVEDGGLDDDLIAMLVAMVLFAGHETTVVQIDHGVMSMLTDPGQWQALLDDPALWPGAVEECVRTGNTGRTGGVFRYPRTDIEVGGVTIPAGDLVLLNVGAANRDENVFADPYGFDVTRETNPHVSFGQGARYCVGAPLARVELQSVFRLLLQEFPALRLVRPVEELRANGDQLTGGLDALQVTW